MTDDSEVCNFADDTTYYDCDQDLDILIKKLEHVSLKAIKWFKANYMKLNEDKCHLIVGGYKFENVCAMIGDSQNWESDREKLLGVYIDNNLNLKFHINEICQKAGRKVLALARMSHYISQDRRIMIAKSFIESQFSYCPLVWMFHDRTMNKKINRLHERALRIVYFYYTSNFDELLEKAGHSQSIKEISNH